MNMVLIIDWILSTLKKNPFLSLYNPDIKAHLYLLVYASEYNKSYYALEGLI